MRQRCRKGRPNTPGRRKGRLEFDPESVAGGPAANELRLGRAGKLALSDGIMSGPEMGLIFEGDVDLTRDTLDISGSYAPLYGLNNLVTIFRCWAR